MHRTKVVSQAVPGEVLWQSKHSKVEYILLVLHAPERIPASRMALYAAPLLNDKQMSPGVFFK